MYWTLLGTALAQDVLVNQNWDLLPSVEAELVEQAVTSNARMFGATGFLERRVFPVLDSFDDEPGLYVGGQMNQVASFLRLPTICNVGLRSLPSDPACYAHVDMFSATGGVAFGNQNVAIFYSAGFTGLYGPDIFISRWIMPFALGGLSFFQMYTAPIQTGPLKVGPGLQDVIGTSRVDYVVGLRGGVGGVSLHAGFYGADTGSGFFTNLSEERVRALVSAVVRDGLGDVPYVVAGVVDSPILAEIADLEGVRPSLFARKLDLASSEVLIADPLGEPVPEDPDTKLWTGHLGSTTKLVDARAAVAWEPTFLLHEAAAAIHTPGYAGSMAAIVGEDFDLEEAAGVRLSAGVVRMPALPWYGITTQTTPFVEVSGAIPVGEAALGEISFGYNSQELLAQFPYARRTFQLRLDWHVFGGKG